jgi:AraC family transcriptional regulator
MQRTTFEDYSQRMLRVLVLIQRNLDEPLSLADLAAEANFSPYHFHRVFRGMVGESLQAHIRRLRLERAAGQLGRGEESILRIALKAGYESHESFGRAFKTMTGMPPSAYREGRRPDADDPARVRRIEPNRQIVFTPLDRGESDMNIDIVTLEPQRVAFVRHVGPYDQCGAAWSKLCSNLGRLGLMGGKMTFIGLSHDDPDVTPADKIRYDACAVVGDGFEPVGEVGVQVIEGGRYAVTVHRGPYDTLNETYAALCGEWLPNSGHDVRDCPSFEVYLNDQQTTRPEDLLTRINLPLA